MAPNRFLFRAVWPAAVALLTLGLMWSWGRPTTVENPPSSPPSSEFRVHRLAAGDSNRFVKRLEQAFAGRGAKIALEPQTNQLIVVGDSNLQTQVALFLERQKASPARIDQGVAHASFSGSPGPAAMPPRDENAEPARLVAPPTPEPTPASTSSKQRTTIIPLSHQRADAVANTLYQLVRHRTTDEKTGPSGLPGFAFLGGPPERAQEGDDVRRKPTTSHETEVRVGVDTGSNSLLVVAPVELGTSVKSLVEILDSPSRAGRSIKVTSLGAHRTQDVVEALQPLLLRPDSGTAQANAPLANEPAVVAQANQAAQAPNRQPPAEGAGPLAPGGGLLGDVEVQAIPGFPDILILRGNARDVEEVQRIIDEIMRLSAETAAEIRIVPLQNVGSESLAETLLSLYGATLPEGEGAGLPPSPVTILPLVKPNAVLIQAPRNRIEQILALIQDLDQPVTPTTQFRVFSLKHATASVAQQVVTEFYADRGGLGTRVTATADLRSNKLLVQASPRDMAEVAAMIARLDVPDTAAENELRFFPLTHALAPDMAVLLNQAITSGLTPAGLAGGAGLTGGATAAGGAQAVAAQAGTQVSVGGTSSTQLMQPRSSTLKFFSVDDEGQRSTKSGILTDVRVTPDPRTNGVLVSAPAESMDLMAELIKQLDAPPSVVAEVKVFTLLQGDAESMGEMLVQLFGQAAGQQQQAGGQGATLLGTAEGETSIVPLRISVDVRSNSIIAAGSAGDLRIVEAILLKLDFSEGREYVNRVIRLRNAPALLVAEAITEFLEGQRRIEQTDPELVSAYERFERDVVVVPEEFTNSLVISATPPYLDSVLKLIDELDQDEPQVVIQVLLAEISLGNTDEFGVELGIQDSILFDRSVSQLIPPNVVNTLDPGFLFNSTDPLGNLAGTPNPGRTGGQGISNFAVGRANGELGFGGLVLSASSESVSVLIRALAECRRLDILSRPQIMTYNNQPALVQVGQTIQIPTGTTLSGLSGAQTNTQERDIGLILRVRPRIRPDGVVVMEVDAEKSALRPLDEGIPILTTTDGEVVRTPIIDRTLASTVVSAADGQTVVIGGLITKRDSHIERKVPFLGDIPILGIPFRYDLDTQQRNELLIILTPRVVRNEQDAELIKQVEANRMNWILRDVVEVHGDIGVYEAPDCEGEDCEPSVLPFDAVPVVPGEAPVPELDFRQGASRATPTLPQVSQPAIESSNSFLGPERVDPRHRANASSALKTDHSGSHPPLLQAPLE